MSGSFCSELINVKVWRLEQVRVKMSFSQMFFIHDFLELQKNLVAITFAFDFQITNRLINFPNVHMLLCIFLLAHRATLLA